MAKVAAKRGSSPDEQAATAETKQPPRVRAKSSVGTVVGPAAKPNGANAGADAGTKSAGDAAARAAKTGAKAGAKAGATTGAKAGATTGTKAGATTGTKANAPGTGPLPTLRILETRVLRGANYWSRQPIVKMLVDLGVLEKYPTTKVPGFIDGLLAWMPSLEDHACSLNRRGGFVTRLRDGTWMGHVSEHVALELQNLAGTPVRHGKTRGAGVDGQYNVIYEFGEEAVGLAAGQLAVRIVNHLVAPNDPAQAIDYIAELERLILLAERQAFGPSTQAILDEAASRDIPSLRLDRHSLVQLGHGVHQQRIRATMTSRTSGIGVDIASDKNLTNRLLDSAGLPVPKSEVVNTVDGALAASKRVGRPCVVKPLDGNHGRGVHLDLRTDDDVRAAFEGARAQSRSGDLVVETFVTGNDYRCLVIGGKMAAIAERVPASVLGDGKQTVRQLVDEVNTDPRRGIGHEKVLTRIKVDAAAEALVKEQGFELDAVPPKDQRVKLALTGNMSTGGTSIDRTLEAHPDNVEIAEMAARVVGLDVAGIDFICPDITVPVRETGGAIVEVNAAPGFRMHTHPTEGEPQYVAKPVIDLLFPAGAPARIPIIAVTGTNGKTTTVRMISHILKLMGRRVGMTSTDGIVVDGRTIRRGDMSGPKSARMILQNPTVDTGVFEVARGGILREGLGFDRVDVAVVTNVTSDHLGLGGIDTLRELSDVKGVIVQAVPRTGTAVLNADDPYVSRLSSECRGTVILFSMETEKGERGFDRVDGYTGRGGAAFVLRRTPEGEQIVLRHGPRVMPVLYTHLVPATFGGKARMNVANALAAAAAAWAAGAHLHDIRQGLRTFTTSFFQAPGRLNYLEVGGIRVVIDYCHNVDGMRNLADFARRMNGDDQGSNGRHGRALGVIGMPGDRRDEDMREYGRYAAGAFDEIIIREDRNLRGRAPGASATLVADGVRKARDDGSGRTVRVDKILDELTAVRNALRRANPGDLVVMCVDDSIAVYREAMASAGQRDGGTAFADPGELEAPEG